jgi:hypothetical protein
LKNNGASGRTRTCNLLISIGSESGLPLGDGGLPVVTKNALAGKQVCGQKAGFYAPVALIEAVERAPNRSVALQFRAPTAFTSFLRV